jgi:hypothetical protein
MKKIFYLLSISMLLLQGCSSDSDNNDNNNGSSAILCKSIRYNESDATNTRNYRDEYIYIGNKLSEMKFYYNDVLGGKSLVFYTGDLITEAKSYNELNRLDGNTVYKYNNSGQLIESISYDEGILDVRDTYIYNQNGTINVKTYYNYQQPETLKSNSTLTYTNGDLVEIDVIEYDGSQVYNNKIITYLYDDKNSPFKNVHSSSKKLLIGYDGFAQPSGNNHNVIKMTETNSNPNFSNSSTNYQYIYNSDNYPTKQTSSNSNSSIVEYTY